MKNRAQSFTVPREMIIGFILATLLFISFLLLVPRIFTTKEAKAATSSNWLYNFNTPGILYASTYIQNSTSPYFWVSSGGRMIVTGGLGETIQGYLPTGDISQVDYNTVNPLDTDHGHYPQNTFRLVTRDVWGNASEKVSFRITAQNLTDTPNRDGYSGIFLFTRYVDKDNLYYAGIRDDGLAVIKKKVGEVYHTLAYLQLYGTEGEYSKWTKPSLLPFNHWMGMKVTSTNNTNGSVRINLSIDQNNTGQWVSMLTVTDNGIGGVPFLAAGHGGIRTDYMDVQFDNFQMITL